MCFSYYKETSNYSRLIQFFFSSRRRHTRLQGDWSSDVCSSDLAKRSGSAMACWRKPSWTRRWKSRPAASSRSRAPPVRSEERRVGKERRIRGALYYLKEKEKMILVVMEK